jgi:DNA integrity scanning protein DisA with diadenylate cyclase activity
MPILEKWMKELDAESKRQLLASCETHYTIKEALAELFPGTTMSKTIHRMIALKVGQIINGLTGEAVPKKNTPNGRGFSMKVNSYTSAQLPLIKLCAQSIWLD